MPVEGRARPRGEDEAMVSPQPCDPQAFLQLTLAVTLQCLHGPSGQTHLASALGGLRGGEGWLPAARTTQTAPNFVECPLPRPRLPDRKSTRLNSSHANISYAVFCLK